MIGPRCKISALFFFTNSRVILQVRYFHQLKNLPHAYETDRMSLYHDAVTILTGKEQQGSLKSRIYSNNTGLKAKPAHLYALISECAKYDVFLKEVIDNSKFLEFERKVSPLLSLLLLHDHFFAKGGIAASTSHPLRLAVERHRARLQAEFTKAKVKRRCGTIEDLKRDLEANKPQILSATAPQPRWVRVNRLKSGPDACLKTTFHDYKRVDSVEALNDVPASARLLHQDVHIPDLFALPPKANLTKSDAYLKGEVILQDKASCFPAYLLLGNSEDNVGDVVDACAAPGNKTTHVAAILASKQGGSTASITRIFACERDGRRSEILRNMVHKAGATRVNVLAKQDFLALDPEEAQFSKVTHLLLDPSCSGSGILGREDIPHLCLPRDPRQKTVAGNDGRQSTKRKRDDVTPEEDTGEEEQPNASTKKEPERLAKLASLQARIVEHAFAFPAARRITFSTCSIHEEENEAVVSRVLASRAAQERGWRVLRRQSQPLGMQIFPHRGVQLSQPGNEGLAVLHEDDLEGCIRCYPNDREGTMGFFVVAFERTTTGSEDPVKYRIQSAVVQKHDEPEDWAGFDD